MLIKKLLLSSALAAGIDRLLVEPVDDDLLAAEIEILLRAPRS